MQPRNKWVHFVMSQDELDRMQQKMQEVGIQNKSAYLRKMALDGYCVNLELEDVKKMVSLLRYCSNNLNQYAKRANATNFIYADDIQDLQNRLEEIWLSAKEILARLAVIQ
ncbi:plasmid mobilization relaxosome protein MobC [Butyricicoccus sp. TM10-16AC]|nr:plasmid mobilization relaxosome protein MobC [Butyricicoccus sp. TM10-16AC]RHU18881.1 plasmid mobilization relaxosome protein MobC [Butyricicoccus sp. TM10-16AC]